MALLCRLLICRIGCLFISAVRASVYNVQRRKFTGRNSIHGRLWEEAAIIIILQHYWFCLLEPQHVTVNVCIIIISVCFRTITPLIISLSYCSTSSNFKIINNLKCGCWPCFGIVRFSFPQCTTLTLEDGFQDLTTARMPLALASLPCICLMMEREVLFISKSPLRHMQPTNTLTSSTLTTPLLLMRPPSTQTASSMWTLVGPCLVFHVSDLVQRRVFIPSLCHYL